MIFIILASLLFLACLGLCGVYAWCARLQYHFSGLVKFIGHAVTGLLLVLVCASVVAVAVIGYYYYRPQPESYEATLFEGIQYQLVSQRSPFPLVYHVVKIQLDTPGLSFLVTPANDDGEHELRAQTTSEFLSKHGLQLAVNGNFFYPFHSNNPWDYYPVTGQPVSVLGEAVSTGDQYSARSTYYMPVSITEDNRIIFDAVEEGYNVLAGKYIDLKPQARSSVETQQRYPRTVFALDSNTNELILLVVDGRQPNYSEGLSMGELAELLVKLGADQAINLDGGGSSTLVIEDSTGKPQVLNTPIHTRIPRRERPVANHLGIFAPSYRDNANAESPIDR